MFERFSEPAIRVIVLSQEEAGLLKSSTVGVEFVLLGILGERRSVAAKALGTCGVRIRDLRAEVAKLLVPGDIPKNAEMQFTTGSKLLFEKSVSECAKLGGRLIGPEHLLLAMLAIKDSPESDQRNSLQVLQELGVELAVLREVVTSSIKNDDQNIARGGGSKMSSVFKSEPPTETTGCVATTSAPPVNSTSAVLATPVDAEKFAAVSAACLSVEGSRVCPNCAETVKAAANVCYFCGYGLSDQHFKVCDFCRERIRIDATKCRYCMAEFASGDQNSLEFQ